MTKRRAQPGRLAAPLLFAAAALTAAACTSKKGPPPKQPVPVATTVVRRAPVPITILANGAVSPMQTANVSSQVDGIITRVNFQEGQDVAKGQVLFQIDARPYEAAYNQAKANMTRDSASAAYAAIEATRYDSLVRKDYVTKEQAGQQEATAAAAAATVQSDAALLATAKFNLDNTTVRAPIAGRTGNLLVRTGNLVHGAAGTPLVLINQIHPILVQFAVPAINLPDIQKYTAAGTLPVTVFQVATPTATLPPGSTQPAADPGEDAPPGTSIAPSGGGQVNGQANGPANGQAAPGNGGRRRGAQSGSAATAQGNGSAPTPAAHGPPDLSATPGATSNAGANAGANGGATDSGNAASNSADDASGSGPPGGGVYGAAAEVVPAGPGVAGLLSFVNNAIDTTTGTVLLKATFDNAKSQLWPGEYVATVLRLYVQQDAIVVPPQAVMTGQQGTYVFVVDTKTNTAQQRAVVIQRSTDTLDVISSGLSAGEHVVTDGQSRLQNGAQVNVRALTNTGGGAPAAAKKSAPAGRPRTTG